MARPDVFRLLQTIDSTKIPKLEYAQTHLKRPALAGILIDLEAEPSHRVLCEERAVRQVLGLKVGVLMENAGWAKTHKKGWLTPFSRNFKKAEIYKKTRVSATKHGDPQRMLE